MNFRVFTAAILLFVAVSTTAAADFSGLTVTSITVKDEQGAAWPNPEALLPLMVVAPGAPYSREDVRKGIGYLYLKGLFRDVRVDGFPEDGGVRLEYTLYPVTIVDRIEIRGNDSLSRSAIVRGAMAEVEGKELRE